MIDSARAIEIARARAEQNGWAFAEPVAIIHRRAWFKGNGRFEIETNAGRMGTKAQFVVDAETAEVLSEGYISR